MTELSRTEDQLTTADIAARTSGPAIAPECRTASFAKTLKEKKRSGPGSCETKPQGAIGIILRSARKIPLPERRYSRIPT